MVVTSFMDDPLHYFQLHSSFTLTKTENFLTPISYPRSRWPRRSRGCRTTPISRPISSQPFWGHVWTRMRRVSLHRVPVSKCSTNRNRTTEDRILSDKKMVDKKMVDKKMVDSSDDRKRWKLQTNKQTNESLWRTFLKNYNFSWIEYESFFQINNNKIGVLENDLD